MTVKKTLSNRLGKKHIESNRTGTTLSPTEIKPNRTDTTLSPTEKKLTTDEVANYLKFGWVNALEYSIPGPTIGVRWEVAVEQIKYYLKRSISFLDLSDAVISFSGGLDSTINIAYLRHHYPQIYSYILKGDPDQYYVKRVIEYWSLKYTNIIPSDFLVFEKDLIEYNKLWDKPRWVTDDLFTYQFYLHGSRIASNVITGLGTEPMFLGFPWMYSQFIMLAIRKRQYDVNLAYKILSKSIFSGASSNSFFSVEKIARETISHDPNNLTYSDLFRKLFEYNKFSDEDISSFGLVPPKIQLRNETIQDAFQCMYDWYNYNLTGVRYPVFEKALGITITSPFYDKNFSDYSYMLPIEYKFCMGSDKHILRNAVEHDLPSFIHLREKKPFSFPLEWFMTEDNKESLIDKYLKDKNNKMFNYLDYDYLQYKLDNQTLNKHQLLMLLNLSIWMIAH